MLTLKEGEVATHWGTAQDEALEDLKTAVINADPLSLPIWGKDYPFVLFTDWSKRSKGAVLCQLVEK